MLSWRGRTFHTNQRFQSRTVPRENSAFIASYPKSIIFCRYIASPSQSQTPKPRRPTTRASANHESPGFGVFRCPSGELNKLFERYSKITALLFARANRHRLKKDVQS